MSGNATSMFSSDAINQAMEQNKEEQKKLKQKILPRGFHLLELVSVKLDRTKPEKGADPMFVITVKKADDKKEEFRPVSEYLVIQENGLTTSSGMNLNVYTLIIFFKNAFNFTPKEPDADDPYGDIETQLKALEGKQFRGVISHKMGLNSAKTKAFPRAGIVWKRCTLISDQSISDQTINANDYFTDLSPTDKAILRGDVVPGKGSQAPVDDPFGTPDVSDDNPDKLPF